MVGNTHSADSANGSGRNRRTAPLPAGLGLREGESKWVLGGIGFGIVGHRNWSNHGKNGNMDIDGGGYTNSRIEMSDHKLEPEMNHRIVVVDDDDIGGTVGPLVEGTTNNPFFFGVVIMLC